MNVIVVDDERLILAVETAEIKQVLPQAEVRPFLSGDDALEYAREHPVDIAFLDINLVEGTGIELAKKLQRLYPRINIIFCTGYSDYALEAFELYCSGYLMKPVTQKKLKEAVARLRYLPDTEKKKTIFVQCFGNFEVFYGNMPVKFKYAKTKEMFAYLIDRKGVLVSTKEIMCVLFEKDDKGSYIRNLKADMIGTLQHLNVEDIFLIEWGKIGIDRTKIECDYFTYLDGKKELFHGEYMAQYSFAEGTLARLLERT